VISYSVTGEKSNVFNNRRRSSWKGTKDLLCEDLLCEDFDIEILNAPFESLFVGIEEDIKTVALNSTAPVEDFYSLAVIVAGDNYFGMEWKFSVGGCESVTLVDLMATGSNTIRKFTAALRTGTIGSYTHVNGLPLFCLSVCNTNRLLFIQSKRKEGISRISESRGYNTSEAY
jgi:hypothetical protein